MKKLLLLSVLYVGICCAPPPSLPNLDNSCYMNAVLQCLLNIHEFTDFLKQDKVQPTNTFVKLYKNYVQDQSQNNLQALYKEVQRELEREEIINFGKWLNTTLYPIFIKNTLDSKAMTSTIQGKIKKVGSQGKAFLTQVQKMYTDYEAAVQALNAKKIKPVGKVKKGQPDPKTKPLQELKNVLNKKLQPFLQGGITSFEKQFLSFVKENQICEQQDFVDLMRVVFSNFENDTAVSSEIQKLMYATQVTIITCGDTTKKSFSPPLGIVSLNMFDLGTNKVFTSLDTILDYNLILPEVVEYENEDCIKSMPFETLGDYFVFNLQRGIQAFNKKGEFVTQKLQNNVDIPLHKDMGPYFVAPEKDNSKHAYELISVAVHSGGTGGGHYVAYVKDQADKKWYLCDDKNITNIDRQTAYNAIQKGYVFFYKRMSDNDMKRVLQEQDSLRAEQDLEKLGRALASLAS